MNLHAVLAGVGRSPEIPAVQDVYGWLVGSGWVLEGRAVQDLWITPPRSRGTATTEKTNNMYGTTLRVWDASIEAWRIIWINPVTGHREEQIGRRSGQDIVQVGSRADGTPTRWMFTEITADSFHWTGEALQPDGKSWKLEGEFRAVRNHEIAVK